MVATALSTTSLTDTQGIVALAAIAVAVLALIVCGALARSVRRLRSAQKLVLGDGAEHDLIAHSASLQGSFEALREYVGDMAVRLDGRLEGVEAALTGAIAHHSLIRYDAYNELSGQQSMSIALLDDRRSGVVLTCIHHRDQARVYAKQVRDGQGELELSPEEAEAVRVALSGGQTAPAAQQRAAMPTSAADATGG
ncbi:MAG: DUF4446 family protein [Solirubrobacteraceae bacterium]